MLQEIIIRNKKTYHGPGEYIGRPSQLGNPFYMRNESEREEVISKYKNWLWENFNNPPVYNELVRLLTLAKQYPLNLICWCSPKACHGDVIKETLIWMEGNGRPCASPPVAPTNDL